MRATGIAVHLGLLIACPPLLLGIIQKTKAAFAGRKGPPLLQPYFDIWKLLQKGGVYSRTTTWIFRAGPIVSLSTAVVVGMLLPLATARAPIGFMGDVLVAAYLLGLGRFFTMLAALDTGSSFEAMGASREAAFSTLAEPALLLTFAVACLPTQSVSLSDVLSVVAADGHGFHPAVLAAAASLFIVLLAENSRIPVDDPNTHLELTMVHEVMVLDHSGPDFAFILYGSAVKLFVFGAMLVHFLVPFAPELRWSGVAWLLGGVFAVAVAVGVVESVMARLRLQRVPQFLFGASVLAAIGLLALLHGGAP
jgi:formate hydrogenlyase subunit 4